MNGYDTVFANANNETEEFDVMFDQEDSLIDTIVGCDENGDPLTGAEVCPAATAEERSCDDCNPDYEKDIDADDSKDAPKDAEGTVGYDFEDEPEVDKKDDETYVDPDDVGVDEDAELDYDIPTDTEGTVDTSPEGPEDGDAPTEPTDDCGAAGCGSCKEDVEVSYDFEKQAKKDVVDPEVEAIEDIENHDSDDILDYVDTDGKGKTLEYDYSDEEIIDDVLNN